MSTYKVYVGSLDRETPRGQIFDWEDGNWDGNAPGQLSPDLPELGHGYAEPFFTIKEMIEGGRWPEWKQTDWGTWVAKVTAAEIRELVAELYGGATVARPERLPPFHDFLATLEEGRQYALAAMET